MGRLKYSKRELRLIRALAREEKRPKEIAHECNARIHGGRAIRTAKGIEFALHSKLKLSKKRFTRICDVCKGKFPTSWPNARYCGDDCQAVIDREYADRQYKLDPAANVQAQTVRVRERIKRRRAEMAKKFGDRCKKCRHKFPRVVFDYHHPNGKKNRRETPSRIIRYGTEAQFQKMLSEVEQWCANCHRIKHATDGDWAPARKGQ